MRRSRAARRASILALALAFAACAASGSGSEESEIAVGSKKFTESVILGEMLAQLARASEGVAAVEHRRELGGTRVLWNALLRGDLDAYVEYTGTLEQEIFAGRLEDAASLEDALDELGLKASAPLGFNNTYALGMRRAAAESLGLSKISDLRTRPDLALGFTNEFLDRGDGWPGLRRRYALPQQARGLDHDLAYRGLEAGDIDVIDCYSTDAEIAYYDLAILSDDLSYFPAYRAVVLYRQDLPPAVREALLRLEGALVEDEMVRLNAAVKIDRRPESEVAAEFLRRALGLEIASAGSGGTSGERGRLGRLLRHSREHLALVGASLGLAILVSVPLGIAAARRRRLGQLILGAVGVLQTVPSLAMLVFMIPLLGIGAPPALAALFLYSLLPIVRNTHAGLVGIAPELRESAEVLGLSGRARLWRIELPLASRSILAGVKTSAVINIGTATLGALIGAGGYGQPILTGIRLDDVSLILEGAVPAAGLALLAQGLFELAERRLVPKGLRLETESASSKLRESIDFRERKQ
ncbi:MAG: glycine betaine ABC transporter substrate-binding protein [Acidobacteriota bacterium]